MDYLSLLPTAHRRRGAGLDALDGPLARGGGLSTESGLYCDSICDRLSELAFITGAVIGGSPPMAFPVVFGSIFLLAARIVNYRKGLCSDAAMFGRPERLALLVAGTGKAGTGSHRMHTGSWMARSTRCTGLRGKSLNCIQSDCSGKMPADDLGQPVYKKAPDTQRPNREKTGSQNSFRYLSFTIPSLSPSVPGK